MEKLFNKLVGTFVNMVVVINRMKYNDRAPAIIIASGWGVEVSHGFQGERSGGQSLSSKYEGKLKIDCQWGGGSGKAKSSNPHLPLHQGGKSCLVPFCFILDSTSCLYRVDFNEMRERGFFHLSKISPLYREIHLFSVLTLPDILLVFSQSIKLNPPPYS